MKLYQVILDMPVSFREYYVLADGFDEAADLAMKRDQTEGGLRNHGINKIEEVIGWADADDGNLIISKAGAAELGLKPGKSP